jgi:hypothetical protein
MITYTIYFEFCGKNMKINIDAESKEDAKNQLLQKIKVHKIETFINQTEKDFFETFKCDL